MSDVEGRYSNYFIKIERSETTLRNSAVRYSTFCGSLFNPGHRSGQSNHQETVPFWGSFIREFFPTLVLRQGGVGYYGYSSSKESWLSEP